MIPLALLLYCSCYLHKLFHRDSPPWASTAACSKSVIRLLQTFQRGTGRIHTSLNAPPNIGLPLLDPSRVTSSSITSQCSVRSPSLMAVLHWTAFPPFH